MSNPNIVYLANDTRSNLKTTAEPFKTITSKEQNQTQILPSENQIPPLQIQAYFNEQANAVPGLKSNFSGLNLPAANVGYYDLGQSAPLNFVESNYIASGSGYCGVGYSSVWGYLPNEGPTLASALPQISVMAVDPNSETNNPTHLAPNPTLLDNLETSKKYNQEVDKFLNRIKMDNVAINTKVKKKIDCDCTRNRTTKTIVKHVAIKRSNTSNILKDHSKAFPSKTKMVPQNKKKIEEIKKQIDLIENEIQRRKTDLCIKEQQIQHEENIIKLKQPMKIPNSSNDTLTNDEHKVLGHQCVESEQVTNGNKIKPEIKSVVNITRNFNLVNSNNFKADNKMRKKEGVNFRNRPYTNPLKSESSAVYNKTKQDNIVISLNLEQELHASNKHVTISQHETRERNDKQIHVTITITKNEETPKIERIKSEEIDGSVIDLSFLDDIDVDEIVECLNVSDQPMETEVSSQKYENENCNKNMCDLFNDLENSSQEHSYPNENDMLPLFGELNIENVNGVAQFTDNNSTIIKSDEAYDELREICNVVYNPGFIECSQKPLQTTNHENGNTESRIPSTLDILAKTNDRVIIKSDNFETENHNTEKGIKTENSEEHLLVNKTKDVKDYVSESAVSLSSYSNSTEYESMIHSDPTPEDVKSDIEQRTRKLLLSIFKNPEYTGIETQVEPKLDILSLNQICGEKDLKNNEKIVVFGPDINDQYELNVNSNCNKTEIPVPENNNSYKEISTNNNSCNTKRNVKTLKLQSLKAITLPQTEPAEISDDVTKTIVQNAKETQNDILVNLAEVNANTVARDQNKILSDSINDRGNPHIRPQNLIAGVIVTEDDMGNLNESVIIINNECENMELGSEEQENCKETICQRNILNISEETQIKSPNKTALDMEMQEKEIVSVDQHSEIKANVVSEAYNDDIIIPIPEVNLEIIDLTEDCEKETDNEMITYSEVANIVQEENKTESNTSDDNVKLPQVEPLKVPRDFALALKLEQGISNYFDSEHEITGIIKRGTYSDIYRARNKNNGQLAAAKVIRNRKNIKQIGIQKAEWMKELQGGVPKEKYHCLYFLHGLVVDGMWCFVLEYYPKNLEQVLIERGKGFCIDTVQKLARQLVSAVLLLRNHKIIHSDIKPRHILFNAENDQLKLAGFDDSFHEVNDKLSYGTGTVHYRAPELILGYFVGHGIDVWSTALVLYEMVTNIKLFPAYTNNEVLYQHLCTLGPAPVRMLKSSKYKDFHFEGDFFLREGSGPPRYKRPPKIIYRFFGTDRINNSVFGAYTKHWARLRSEHKGSDVATLHQFIKLLKQMLTVDPYCRIGIESVYAHGFIYE